MRIRKIDLSRVLAGLAVAVLAACGGGGASQSVPIVNPPSPSPQAAWNITGSLQIARYGHTATVLADGRVLVVGGNYLTDSFQSIYPVITELYDPVTKVWTPAGTLTNARVGHTATLLPNGKVLVAGGRSQTGVATSVELYDPVAKVWTVGGGMTTTRFDHTATLLPNGKVLVAGGYRGDVGFPDWTGVEFYDPSSNTWTAGGTLLAARAQHTATLLPNGRVLLIGGARQTPAAPAVELYDPTANISTVAAASTLELNLGSATLLSSGSVLFVVGSQSSNSSNPAVAAAVLYNPSTNSWANAGTLSTWHDGHTATRLGNGAVLVVGGGTNSSRQGNNATDIVELYDPTANSWSVTKVLVQGPRLLHTSTLLSSGAVLVVGGTSSIGTLGPLAPPSAAAALYSN